MPFDKIDNIFSFRFHPTEQVVGWNETKVKEGLYSNIWEHVSQIAFLSLFAIDKYQ